MYVIWSYLIGINLISFILMGIDKRRAREKKYRISEQTLWLWAIIGGALGGAVGMFYFRHKTKHLNFKIGFPILAVIHVYLFIKWQYGS